MIADLTPEEREKYDRATKAITGHLYSVTPPPPQRPLVRAGNLILGILLFPFAFLVLMWSFFFEPRK